MDRRSSTEKALWDSIGPPLYYCSDCLRGVKVEPIQGQEPKITRPCGEDCGHQIIAPRSCILAGEGGLSVKNKLLQLLRQLLAAATRRNV